jgi:hypothetical protein
LNFGLSSFQGTASWIPFLCFLSYLGKFIKSVQQPIAF